jgi:hypothetical protein
MSGSGRTEFRRQVPKVSDHGLLRGRPADDVLPVIRDATLQCSDASNSLVATL